MKIIKINLIGLNLFLIYYFNLRDVETSSANGFISTRRASFLTNKEYIFNKTLAVSSASLSRPTFFAT